LEYVDEVKSGSTNPTTSYINLHPGAVGAGRLDSFAGLFELYRFKSCKVHYRASVGSTVDGMLHVSADFDPADIPVTVTGVASKEPVVSAPVWKDTNLPIPVSRLNKGTWMYTAINATGVTHPELGSCGIVAWGLNHGATDKSFGELWLEYEVEFSSPTRSGDAASSLFTRNAVFTFPGGSGSTPTLLTNGLVAGATVHDISTNGSFTIPSVAANTLGSEGWVSMAVDASGYSPSTALNLIALAADSAHTPGSGAERASLVLTKGRVLDTSTSFDQNTSWGTLNFLATIQSDVAGAIEGFLHIPRNTIADASTGAVALALSTVGFSPSARQAINHLLG
jgi:hypothetical protein